MGSALLRGLALVCGGISAMAVAAGACGSDDSGGNAPEDAGAGDAPTAPPPDDGASPADASDASDAGAGLDAGPFGVDTTFGTGGLATFGFATPGNTEGHGLARQADGKLLVAGFVRGPQQGPHVSSFVARFLPSGAVDTTFGSGGIAWVTHGLATEAVGVFVQSTQKIVVVMQSILLDGTGEIPLVTRFDATGALDTSFGTQGFVTLDGFPWSAAMQPDDAILVGVNEAPGIGVYRLQPNGKLDTAFGDAGLAASGALGPAIDDFALLRQADGKIVVGGVSTVGFLTRFTAAGGTDPSFTTDTDLATPSEIDWLAQAPDGTLLASGRHAGNFAVGRFSLAGAGDPTFGTSGWQTLGNGEAQGVVVQPDGKIVAAGLSAGYATPAIAARFGTDGGLDTTFGTSGVAPLSLGPAPWIPAIALDPDGGAITVAGRNDDSPNDLVVAQLAPNGALDPSFASGAVITKGVGGSQDHALAVAIQPSDGKVIVAGNWAQGAVSGAAVARVTTAGALDTSFASTGKETVSNLGGAAGNALVQSTGRVVLGAWSDDLHATPFAAVAYDANGGVDGTFGTSGKASITTVGGQPTNAKATALGPADSIVFVGGNGTTSTAFVVAELDASGKPSTFGADGGVGGAVTTASAFGAAQAEATAALVQSDGAIVAAGVAGTKIALARYATSGSLDATFGTAGVTTTDLAAAAIPYAIVAHPSGALAVAARRVNADLTSDVVLARYSATGTLDATFGTGGLATYSMGHVYRGNLDLQPPFVGLVRASDGRYYVATTASSDDAKENVLLLRFTSAGIVDAASAIPLGAGNDEGAAIALDAMGRLVVVGHTWTAAGGEDFFVARLLPPP